MQSNPPKTIFHSLINRYQDYMPLRRQDSGSQKPPSRRSMQAMIILSSLVALLIISIFLLNTGGSHNVNEGITTQSHPWTKPHGLTIVALVFYGRRANVQILERYLRENLVDNGGVLDRVHFVSRVRHKEDADFLMTIIDSNPRYTYRDFGTMDTWDFTAQWDHDIESDTLYVKIDDDIIYISKNAITDLVAYKVNHTEHLFVSANIVNHPNLQKVHNAFMIPQPFAPEQLPLESTTDWGVSTLPTSPLEEIGSMDEWPEPPEYKHRWLPMRNSDLEHCPLREGIEFLGKRQWECATIAHYSLFQHIENFNERIYDFGVWDFNGITYERWSINFFVAWGHEIIDARPIPQDDEYHLSVEYPRIVRKRTAPWNREMTVDSVAVGSALVAHLSYFWQGDLLGRTDVLDRYKLLVMDTVGNDLLVYDH